MVDRPPPTQPPAGWYPDPSGGPGYRWWDGSAWTDADAPGATEALPTGPSEPDESSAPPATDGVAAMPPPPGPQDWASPVPSTMVGQPVVDSSTFRPIGEWLSETTRLAASRIGHVLPLVLLLILALNVGLFVLLFYGMDGSVLELADDGTASFEYGGSPPALYGALALVLLSLVTVAMFKSSVGYQLVAARNDRPEEWSASFARSLRRAGRIVPATLARSLSYWLVGLVFLLLAAAVPPLSILALPVLAIAVLFLWSRLSTVGIGAAIGPDDHRPLVDGFRMTGGDYWPLLGRLLILAVLGFNLLLAVNILSSPLVLAVAGDLTPSADPSAQRFVLGEQLGPTAPLAALRAFLSGLGIAANHLLTTAGTVLLYLRLGGRLDDALMADGPPVDPSES